MLDVSDVVNNMPKPTADNKSMFVLLKRFLEVVAHTRHISDAPSVDDCTVAYGPLAEVLACWPMEQEGSELVFSSSWEEWAFDLTELGLDRPVVYQRLCRATVQIQPHIDATSHV